ncbi:MAG: SIS domain-containing protein [Deltaproteobacteria bacterium]|nr:SIS domain-containing protein [Deltaproteobacteria bacterium]
MQTRALEIIHGHLEAGEELRKRFFDQNAERIVQCARAIAVCLARGAKVLLCGNGGSAADSQHIAAEFVNRYRMERPPLPAIALTTDTSILTAIANDYSFDQVFVKQVQALGLPGDVLIGISTSGNSPNVNRAMNTAREAGILTIGLCGGNGGNMSGCCDHFLLVPIANTPVVQEIHICIGHLLCELTDYFLFEGISEIQSDIAALDGNDDVLAE